MNVPEGTTKDYMDWDAQSSMVIMVVDSSIPHECVGVKKTYPYKKVIRISLSWSIYDFNTTDGELDQQ